MPPKPKNPQTPDLNFYGLKRLGYDESVLPLTGDYFADQVMLEGLCYRISHKPEEGGLGKFGHMQAGVNLLWNRPESGSAVRLIWNTMTNKMLRKACEEAELGVAGATSIGKSSPFAMYAVWNYVVDPTHCLCLVLSTTIGGAKKRIWRNVREYWDSIPNLPGKALWSSNQIQGLNYAGDGFGDSSGIFLIASEQSNEKAALDKFIGVKAARTGNPTSNFEELMSRPEYADLARHFDEETLRDLVPRLQNLSQDRVGKLIIVLDEATGCTESILNAYNTNLKPGNTGHCQMIMLGNPASPYDTFAQFCQPKGGWDSVDLINDEEWRTTTGGLCIRFNGERNPRIVENDHRLSWMLRLEDIQAMEDKYGRDSMFFHRMVLGTWCLNGSESGIYSPADIELSGSRKNSVVWGMTPPTPVSFLDPAFTAGGDRSVATFGLVGDDVNGNRVFLVTARVTIKFDINNNKIPISYQIVHNWKKECQARNVPPQNAAYDRTGGGETFGAIVFTQWSPMVTGITAGGPASKNPLPGEFHPSTKTPVLAHERFANRATEIWYSAHPLFRSNQIFGVDEELAKELCSRQHDKAGGGKLKVEAKRVYRDREGKSPDESDSFLGLIDFCRTRFKLHANEKAKALAEMPMTSTGRAAWEAMKARARRISNRKNLKSS